MNHAFIARLLSRVLLVLACAFCISTVVQGVLNPGHVPQLVGWVWCVGAVLVLSCACAVLGRRAKGAYMYRKEALAFIGLAWVVVGLLGALPYYLLAGMPPSHAVFESFSGITTTGATVVENPQALPVGVLFWRGLSQWLGGLGVVMFFVALFAHMGAGAKILYSNEASTAADELETSRVRTGAVRVLLLYITFTALCAGTYAALGMPAFDALYHGMTTIATSGFSTRAESLAYWNSPAIEWAGIGFMVLGGTSLLYILRLMRHPLSKEHCGGEVRIFWGIWLVASLLVAGVLYVNMHSGMPQPYLNYVRGAMFNVTSLLTTTGYATENFAVWPVAAQLILLCAMAMGASSGSTAGGLKTVRVWACFQAAKQRAEQAFHPRVVRPVVLNGRALSAAQLEGFAAYVVLALGFVALGTVVFALLEPGLDFISVLSGVWASVFNVGPALGKLGPTETYGGLSAPSHFLLSFLMLLGRLEFYALLIWLTPAFWRRF